MIVYVFPVDINLRCKITTVYPGAFAVIVLCLSVLKHTFVFANKMCQIRNMKAVFIKFVRICIIFRGFVSSVKIVVSSRKNASLNNAELCIGKVWADYALPHRKKNICFPT